MTILPAGHLALDDEKAHALIDDDMVVYTTFRGLARLSMLAEVCTPNGNAMICPYIDPRQAAAIKSALEPSRPPQSSPRALTMSPARSMYHTSTRHLALPDCSSKALAHTKHPQISQTRG